MTATRQLVVEGVWLIGRQNADNADTLHLWDIAMALATTFWLSKDYNFGCMIASDTLFHSRGAFSGSSYPMKTADFEVLRDVAMATNLGFVWDHIGATWWIRLNRPCAASMRPCVKLLWPLVTARRSYARVVLGVVILSVCLPHVSFVKNPKNLPAIFLYHIKGQSLVKCDFSYSCAAADNISTDLRHRAVRLR